jgi:hypothetical protein
MQKKLSGTCCFLLAFLLASIIVALIQASVSQASETIAAVEPYENSANVGQTFTVNLTISTVQNLYGVGLTLNWNSTVLRLENFDVQFGESDGVLYNPIYVAENFTLEGKYFLSATSTNPAPSFNGSGKIAGLTFRVLVMGETALDLETQLYDYPPPDRDPRISLPIAHVTTDAVFQGIIPEFSSPTILLGFLFLALLTSLLVKKIWRQRSRQNVLVDNENREYAG